MLWCKVCAVTKLAPCLPPRLISSDTRCCGLCLLNSPLLGRCAARRDVRCKISAPTARRYPFVMPVALAENDSFAGGSPDLLGARNFNSKSEGG